VVILISTLTSLFLPQTFHFSFFLHFYSPAPLSNSMHASSHTLDLYVTRLSSQLITSVSAIDLGISDHLAISSSLSIPNKTRPPRITKATRCYRSIDPAAFSNDILLSSLYTAPADNLTSYVDQFNSTLSSVLDKHAPLKTMTFNQRTHKPFITGEIRLQKTKRSKLETIFRRTRLPSDLFSLKPQARHVAKLITAARRAHFKSLITSFTNQCKKLWSCRDSLFSRTSPSILPSSTSTSALATSFLDFFNGKKSPS
jgi:hypothetical protein